jgi:putative tryptophan/tyrosine transport system substrate-binding protein
MGPVLDGSSRRQIAALALRDGVPAIAQSRDFAIDGGLLSYGPSLTDAYYLKGIYAGKILKGATSAEAACSATDEV